LLCKGLGVCVAGVDYVEGMGFGQATDGEGSDGVLPGDHGGVEKADADTGGDQGFDRNEAADGYLSQKVV